MMICAFVLHGIHYEAREGDCPALRGLQAFKDGFWINARGELTVGDDCLYWIPPSAILHIKKERKHVSSDDRTGLHDPAKI